MSLKVILFDFDGTLADSLTALVAITNRLAGEFGYKRVALEELEQVRNLSSRQIIKESGVSIFQIPFLLRRVKAELRQDIEQLNPVVGIKEILVQLNEEGNRLGILTSNSEENVRTFLIKHKMLNLFRFIDSGVTLFGKDKALKRMMIQNKFRAEELIYVGDETRDIDAAKKIPIQVIAVSWGFNSSEALAQHYPNFLIHHPSELIEIIARIQ